MNTSNPSHKEQASVNMGSEISKVYDSQQSGPHGNNETCRYICNKRGIDFYIVKYSQQWTFRNVQGTSYYTKTKGFSSWIGLYRKYIDSSPDFCRSCGKKTTSLVGGHMKRKDKWDINVHHVIPICHKCNNYRNDKTTEATIPAGTPMLKAVPTLTKRAQKAVGW